MADDAPELVDELRAFAVQADALRHRLKHRKGREADAMREQLHQAWQGAAGAVSFALIERNRRQG